MGREANPIEIGLGTLAFALFFVHDANAAGPGTRKMIGLFPLGCIVLLGATIWAVMNALAIAGMPYGLRIVWLALALVCFLLLLYALFLAIPFSPAYTRVSSSPRHVTRTGLYGLCRHPGVPILAGMYLFLALTFPSARMFLFAAIVSVLDLGYAAYQDRWIFPRQFSDYDEYRRQVPFLLPNLGRSRAGKR